MLRPNLRREKKLFLENSKPVVGLDEAGRGSWAGPLVAGAVIIKPQDAQRKWNYRLIRDSKLLTFYQRERAFNYIHNTFEYAFGMVESHVIDHIGISRANQLAMNKALAKLYSRPYFVLVDGRGFYFDIPFENIIDGDAKVFSISAASIVAKVIRDRIMREYDTIYGIYKFSKHKGYGTRLHKSLLKEFGVCPIHRRSFMPIRELLKE